MRIRRLSVLVVGSGTAGLRCAVRLHELGVTDLAVYTEGLQGGTSINTGSDKQTYYKLGMYGAQADSPWLMAGDLAAGGSMHGDLALVEASVSPLAFSGLVAAGVPFPHDEYGQYIGYKTDHDTRRRATSTGPYTSRDMCRALIAQLRLRGIEVCEKRLLVQILVREGRCRGGVFLDLGREDDPLELVEATNTVFATGGPGGLYQASVYPTVHTGGVGVALAAGAKARNLPESQFGIAAVRFRWNLSGSYMQAIPRVFSQDADGQVYDFLRPYFPSASAVHDAIFLKGYQWPFAVGNLPGSSLIDVLFFEEARQGRRVFLDYRTEPPGLDFAALSAETRDYLEKCNALVSNPLERLRRINPPAIELFREHGIDLGSVPLECAVCAQHCNGGLAGDCWWQSENLPGLFPIGEVNGSHGVTRPGGSALNSGQVGALRAAEFIARTKGRAAEVPTLAWDSTVSPLQRRREQTMQLNWREERRALQARMSESAGFLRDESRVAAALEQTQTQLACHQADGLAGASLRDQAEHLRNESLLTAAVCYLHAILTHIRSGAGARGGAAVLSKSGHAVHPALPWLRIAPEDQSFRSRTLETTLVNGEPVSHWVNFRAIPQTDGWFETVWAEYRAFANPEN
ncbi:MAG: FAD-binding protein [Victivallales bacterium]|nr:FAD-binding protein [Victivallales bacterium]